MLQSLAKLSLLEILMEMDYFVEDNWQFIKAGLMEILDKKVPKKKLGTQSDTPWITRDLKRLLRKKKRL